MAGSFHAAWPWVAMGIALAVAAAYQSCRKLKKLGKKK